MVGSPTQLISCSGDAGDTMSKAKPFVLAIIGVSLLGFVVYNVEVGLYYFQYPDSIVNYKVELAQVFAEECSKENINQALQQSRSSPCLSPLGTYHATDIVLAGVGFAFSLASPFVALKQAGKMKINAKVAKNWARIRLLLGFAMVSVGVADATGMLTGEGQPLDWKGVIGLPVPAFVVEIALVIAGAMVVMKAVSILKKKPRSEADDAWTVSGMGGFRGPLEKNKKKSPKDGGVMTVGQLRSALSLDEYEDLFQQGTSTSDEISVGRQCHYCNGQGCVQCDYKGEFH